MGGGGGCESSCGGGGGQPRWNWKAEARGSRRRKEVGRALLGFTGNSQLSR